jgi:hypothetical protein
MDIKSLLIERKYSILNKWFEIILDSYPVETAKFLRDKSKRFTNPVGSTIYQGIESLLDEIIDDKSDSSRLSLFLDNIIRIRAIQDFSASQAVAFIFSIKDIIRQEVDIAGSSNDPLPQRLLADLTKLNAKIDSLALMSFDIYMQCREKIYDIKANEARNMTYRLLQQAKIITESPVKED